MFAALLINVCISLVRIPIMGFHPFMLLHVCLFFVGAILYFARKRLRPDISAFVIVAMFCLLLISGVATLGLLSATFVLGPMTTLYLMLLGRRKLAYASIIVTVAYIATIGILYVSGTLQSAAPPDLYMRSPAAWMLAIVAVAGASVAFVAPFELIPGALEGSEERFRLAFENANVGICFTSLEGRFLKANNALCEMLGYSREELEQLPFSDITHPDDKVLSLNAIKRQQSGGAEKVNFEKRYIHKRGDVIWANVSSSLIRDSQGLPQHFITHIHNITERKLAEAALIESETKFRSIFENAHDVYFETTLEGDILEISPSIEILSKGQYTRRDVMGQSYVNFYYDSTVRVALLELLRERQQLSDFEIILKNRDGAPVECSISAKLQYSPQKNSTIISGTIRDISERKKAERSVRESETRFRELWDATVEGIAIHNKGRILEVNGAMCRMFGTTREQTIGKSFVDFAPAEIRDALLERAASETEERFETQALRPDGTKLFLEVFSKHIFYHDEKVRMATVRDITERKEAEESLRVSESKLRSILDNTHEAIGVHINGIWEMCNPAAVRLFGASSPSDLLGKPILNVIVPHERDRVSEIVRKRLTGSGAPVKYVTRGVRSDRSVFDMDVTLSSFTLDNKLHVLVILRDITERKRAEDALRESEERYQRITEAITDYIYTVRVVDGRVAKTAHGPGCLAVTGYHPSEFADDPFLWFKMVVAEDRSKVEEQARQILQGMEPQPIEHRIFHKNGSVRWMRNTFVLHHDEYGTIDAYDGLIQDITERKEAEEALQESESKYRELVEGFPDAIAIYGIIWIQTVGLFPLVRHAIVIAVHGCREAAQ